MPLTLTAALSDHLDREALTLATLWEIIRVDGVTYRYTDHDQDITFEGQLYKSGVGYDRSAIEDKADLSSDNLNIQGTLSIDEITREDIRAGLLDGAEVWVRIVNWEAPDTGSLIRRRGWLGELKQNNLGQFDTELRGIAEAMSENLSRVYTPGCPADLGSVLGDNTEAWCGRDLVPPLRTDDTFYEAGKEVRVEGTDDIVFRATLSARYGEDPYDDNFFYASIGETISDGEQIWEVFEAWRIPGVVNANPTPDRRTFEVTVSTARLDADPRHFDQGLVTFRTGANEGVSREIKYVDQNSDGAATVVLYLRSPFDINAGDLVWLFPGCDKSIETCHNKFANAINFKGFPHVPGDDYLKNYPDAKL